MLVRFRTIIKDRETSENEKGYAAKRLLGLILISIANELKGKPLSNHYLFSQFKNTFLKDYTLEVKRYDNDNEGSLWKEMLMKKQTDLLLFPQSNMRPDLFANLKCIYGTVSYQQYGDHV